MKLMKYLLVVLMSNIMVYAGFFDGGITPGASARDFSLQDKNGNEVSLHDYLGKIIVLEWRDPDCKFVRKYYDNDIMQNIQQYYVNTDKVVWLTILVNESDNRPNTMGTVELLDPDFEVTKLYNVKKVPEVIVIDQIGVISYVGAIDSVRSFKSSDVLHAKSNYLKDALDSLLSVRPILVSQTSPFGCKVSERPRDNFREA